MIHFKQLRPFFATSSGTWMLLLLSFYFSWICPTESNTLPCGYNITLVEQPAIEVQGRCCQHRFKASRSHKNQSYLPIFSFQEYITCLQIQVEASWYQGRQRQNLLPAPSSFYQFQTHLPRSIAAC